MKNTDYYELVLSQLEKLGLLLESDPKFPSVCTLIAKEPMKGSWWSHPMAQTIFQVNERLDDHPDIVITKLVSNKVTFVHRRLWPELFAVATSKESWQIHSLSAEAREVLRAVEKQEWVRSDEIKLSKTTVKPGDAVRQIEQRLLVHAQQVHTEGGKHAKMLKTWEHWAIGAGLGSPDTAAIEAKRTFEQILQKLNEKFDGNARLPWRPLK